MNIIPPAIRFKGNQERAISLKSPAVKLYHLVVNQGIREGLNFVTRNQILEDGSIITFTSTKQSINDSWAGVISILGAGGGKVVEELNKIKVNYRNTFFVDSDYHLRKEKFKFITKDFYDIPLTNLRPFIVSNRYLNPDNYWINKDYTECLSWSDFYAYLYGVKIFLFSTPNTRLECCAKIKNDSLTQLYGEDKLFIAAILLDTTLLGSPNFDQNVTAYLKIYSIPKSLEPNTVLVISSEVYSRAIITKPHNLLSIQRFTPDSKSLLYIELEDTDSGTSGIDTERLKVIDFSDDFTSDIASTLYTTIRGNYTITSSSVPMPTVGATRESSDEESKSGTSGASIQKVFTEKNKIFLIISQLNNYSFSGIRSQTDTYSTPFIGATALTSSSDLSIDVDISSNKSLVRITRTPGEVNSTSPINGVVYSEVASINQTGFADFVGGTSLNTQADSQTITDDLVVFSAPSKACYVYLERKYVGTLASTGGTGGGSIDQSISRTMSIKVIKGVDTFTTTTFTFNQTRDEFSTTFFHLDQGSNLSIVLTSGNVVYSDNDLTDNYLNNFGYSTSYDGDYLLLAVTFDNTLIDTSLNSYVSRVQKTLILDTNTGKYQVVEGRYDRGAQSIPNFIYGEPHQMSVSQTKYF